MEFKKINENTFECLLSKEDLEDFDITMEDFLKDQDKTMDFMRKIIERSEEEIDFEPSSGMVSMQISPLPGDGLSLVFSNRQPVSGMDLLTHVRDIIRSHMEGMVHERELEDEEDHVQSGDENTGSQDGEKHTADFMDLKSIMEEMGREESEKGQKKNAVENARMYRFERFSDLERFCKSWHGKSVKSQILKQEQDQGYYLVIEKGRLSRKEYIRLGESLAEYAGFVTDQHIKIVGIREHAKVVIAKDAIAMLHDL